MAMGLKKGVVGKLHIWHFQALKVSILLFWYDLCMKEYKCMELEPFSKAVISKFS